jgi:hypothetical protein
MIRTRLWQPETAFFLILWFLLLWTGRSSLLRDPGTLWHTVVGERMIQTGDLVCSDPFSFTYGGQPWTPHQWLSEILMALLDRLGGLDALLLTTVTILAAIYAWIGGRLVRAGLHWMPAALLMALTVAASSYHFHARPHLVSIALVGWTYAQLCDFEANRINLRRLFWLIPVFMLWVNLHGGVLAGIALVGLAIAGWSAWKVLGQTSPVQSGQTLLALIGLVLGLGLATLVNPYGLEMLQAWRTIMTADLPRFIQEHAPPDFRSSDGLMLALLAALYVFILLGTLRRWPRVTWLLPLVLFYLSLGRVRHGPLFAVTGMLAIAEMLPHCRWTAWLASKGSQLIRVPTEQDTPEPGLSRWAGWLIPGLVVVAALLLQVTGVQAPVVGQGWAVLDPAHWPVDLLPALRAENATARQRIFNDLRFGGFLIRYAPDYEVFIDDRCELYGNDFLLAYDQAARENPAQIEAWRGQYGFQHALVLTGSAFDGHLRQSPEWTLVAESPAASLFRHR